MLIGNVRLDVVNEAGLLAAKRASAGARPRRMRTHCARWDQPSNARRSLIYSNRAGFSPRKLKAMATSTSSAPSSSSLATTVASSRRPTTSLASAVSVCPNVATSALVEQVTSRVMQSMFPTASSMGLDSGGSSAAPGSSGLVVSASYSPPSFYPHSG